jgi:hypothetical protein
MEQYLRYTRSPWFAYLFSLPLLVLYQFTAVVANMGRRDHVINGADAIVQNLLSLAGLRGWLGSWMIVALIAGIVVYRKDAWGREKPLRPGYFGAMLAESAVYALFFGSVVAYLTTLVLPGAAYLQIGQPLQWGQKLASSLGAGLYEELVFRLLLTGSLLWGFRRLKWKDGAAVAAAVLISSLVFSLFHYVGAYGEPFRLGSFTFRFIAGIVLAILFAVRGFAVAAWTHSLYDVFLLATGHV